MRFPPPQNNAEQLLHASQNTGVYWNNFGNEPSTTQQQQKGIGILTSMAVGRGQQPRIPMQRRMLRRMLLTPMVIAVRSEKLMMLPNMHHQNRQ